MHSAVQTGFSKNADLSRSVDGELMTPQRGFRKSTFVSGTLTGIGGDCYHRRSAEAGGRAMEARSHRLNQWVSNTMHVTPRKKKRAVIVGHAARDTWTISQGCHRVLLTTGSS